MTLDSDVKAFRLGVLNPIENSAFCHGRILGPLQAMAREDRRLEIVMPTRPAENNEWDLAALLHTWILGCDAIYVQNAFTDVHVQVIGTARAAGVPVWVDYGDDLLNVRPCNPSWAQFSNVEVTRQIIAQVIKLADVTSVCTETLRNSFPLPERIVVIGDCCPWPASELPRRKIVTWRGMSSHEEDIDSVLPELCNVAADPLFADWEWVLFGDPRWNLVEKLVRAAGKERVMTSPYWPTALHFMEAWKGIAPYLHIVPLADNEFNRAKTANAWFEATAIGAAVIGPDLPEWRMPGMIHYSTGTIVHGGTQSFEEVLRREMARFAELRSANVSSAACHVSGGGEPPRANVETASTIAKLGNGAMHPNVFGARQAIYPAMTLKAVNQNRWAILRKLWRINHFSLAGAVTATKAPVSEWR